MRQLPGGGGEGWALTSPEIMMSSSLGGMEGLCPSRRQRNSAKKRKIIIIHVYTDALSLKIVTQTAALIVYVNLNIRFRLTSCFLCQFSKQ